METRQQQRAKKRQIAKIVSKIEKGFNYQLLTDSDKKLYLEHLDTESRNYLNSVTFTKGSGTDEKFEKTEFTYQEVLEDSNIHYHDDGVLLTEEGYGYSFPEKERTDVTTWNVILQDIRKMRPDYMSHVGSYDNESQESE